MSPRAAARLESIGFGEVYDYVGGKADWGSAGLPLEGTSGSESRAGAHVSDAATCALDERLPEVRQRARSRGVEICIVVGDSGIVLGLIGRRALAREDDIAVDEAMTSGPSTIRPSARLDAIVERMTVQRLTSIVVTTSEGRLVGVLERGRAEAGLSRRS
jgi:CBS domain-containing protein